MCVFKGSLQNLIKSVPYQNPMLKISLEILKMNSLEILKMKHFFFFFYYVLEIGARKQQHFESYGTHDLCLYIYHCYSSILHK